MNDIIINKDNYLKGMYKMKIIKNRVRCKSCGNIIESTSTHDIKSYRCGSITVDGGKDYIRRGFKEIVDLEDLSICVYYLSDPQDKRLLEIEKNPRKPYKTKKLRDFL